MIHRVAGAEPGRLDAACSPFRAGFACDAGEGHAQLRTWRAQTALDIGISRDGRWGINLGFTYLRAQLDAGGGEEIDVDPAIARVLGVFRR
jgi:hypothetical protein